MLQAISRHKVILQLSPPLSEMELEMSRASRYQKKVVAELLSHSGSMAAEDKNLGWIDFLQIFELAFDSGMPQV